MLANLSLQSLVSVFSAVKRITVHSIRGFCSQLMPEFWLNLLSACVEATHSADYSSEIMVQASCDCFDKFELSQLLPDCFSVKCMLTAIYVCLCMQQGMQQGLALVD